MIEEHAWHCGVVVDVWRRVDSRRTPTSVRLEEEEEEASAVVAAMAQVGRRNSEIKR